MTQTKAPIFRTQNGNYTAYAFACGYIQWASNTGKEIDVWENGKQIYLDGCVYHVKHYQNDIRVEWSSFDKLSDGQKHYKSIVI